MDVKNYADIKKDLRENFMALQDKVTDFNEGSVIDSMFDSFAREEEKKYIATKLGFTQNLKAVPYSLFDFQPKPGTYATGTVVFKRGAAKNFQTVIPEGTEVSAGSLNFVTTETGTVGTNETESLPVTVKAVNVGSDYNVSARSMTQIVSVVSSDIVEVVNNDKFDGGCDNESETEMLRRFKNFISGLQGTSNYGLKSAVENIEGVRSVNVVEDFSSGAIYRVIVYAEDGSGSLASSIKSDIEDVIEGDGTPNNPGKRAPGINVLVSAPTIVNTSFNVTVRTYRADPVSAENEITDTVRNYVNGLGIGEDVVLTSIILLLRSLTYVKDVEITLPTTNIRIANNQIARFGDIVVELEEE